MTSPTPAQETVDRLKPYVLDLLGTSQRDAAETSEVNAKASEVAAKTSETNAAGHVTQTGEDRTHVDSQVAAIDTAFTESVPPYLQPDAPGGLKATFAPNTKIFTPEAFGAVGDGVIDDADAIQAAIDAAYAAGGGRVQTRAGTRYFIGSRVRVRSDVSFEMGRTGTGSALQATYASGVDMEAGSNFEGTIYGDRWGYTGPCLQISTDFGERPFGPRAGVTTYNLNAILGGHSGTVGLRLHAADGKGLQWTRGTAEIVEADFPVVMHAESYGWVNENELDVTAEDAIDYLTMTTDGVSTAETNGNRINLVAQTGGNPRARKVVNCAGKENTINLRSWDFNGPARWHPEYDGNFIHFLEGSSGNTFRGSCYTGTGTGIVDKSTSTDKNVILLDDFRRRSPDFNFRSRVPTSYLNPVMNGSEDDVFAFAADGRWTVTIDGDPQLPVTAERMFRPGGLNAEFPSVTEMTIMVDVGAEIPDTDMSAIGVLFGGLTPDFAELMASKDGVDWTNVLSSSTPSDRFVRQDTTGITGAWGRYFRLRITNNTAKSVSIHRFFLGLKAGSIYDYGAWLPKYQPDVLDSLRINGQQVLGPRQAGFPAPSGVRAGGDFDADTATLDDLKKHYAALLSALRTMGIVGD